MNEERKRVWLDIGGSPYDRVFLRNDELVVYSSNCAVEAQISPRLLIAALAENDAVAEALLSWHGDFYVPNIPVLLDYLKVLDNALNLVFATTMFCQDTENAVMKLEKYHAKETAVRLVELCKRGRELAAQLAKKLEEMRALLRRAHYNVEENGA